MNNFKFLVIGFVLAILTACSHDFETYVSNADVIKAKYDAAFIQAFSKPAPSQTWGFSTAIATTRAASVWNDTHSCNWADKLDFVLPAGAVDVTDPALFNQYGNYQGPSNVTAWYVPTGFSGSLDLHNMNLSGSFYNYGTLTSLTSVNYNGTVTFYNAGTMTYSVQSGNRHTVINTGTLTVTSFNNVGEIYNGGSLVLDNGYKADIPNAMSIFSNGEGSVYVPNGADFKAAADIHGTLTSDKDLKIQNSNTQYICGVKVDGTLDMTQGKLESSYISATEIKFDGSAIWLTPGGHISADVIRMPNSATAIYGEGSSTGLIEVGDIYFQNTNNFDDSFSGNIYFKVTGSIDFSNSTKFGGQGKHYNGVGDYNAENSTLKGYGEGDTASGSPDCGQPWSVGTPAVTPEPEEPTTPEEPGDDYTKFICRVFAEDLSVSTSTDFDFNDIVFDVFTNGTDAKVVLLAAGGTLPLYVNEVEVHGAFGVSVSTMVNTGFSDGHTADPIFVSGVASLEDVNEKITLIVVKDGENCVLTAYQGEPAAKFAVTKQIDWQLERQKFVDKYPGFKDWVSNPSVQWW